MSRNLSRDDRDYLLKDIDQVVQWSLGAVKLIEAIFSKQPEFHNGFGSYRSSFMSMVRNDGAMDLYHGGLRAVDEQGQTIFDHVDYSQYSDFIHEEVKSWSYMKFPFIRSRGTDAGWYRVGPLARVNNCDFIPTPLADAERRTFKEFGGGSARHATLAFHWARMIEMLHSAEAIQELLQDDDLLSDDLVHAGERQLQGVGVIEAPRGTLIHHYQINEDEQIVRANLIVATTHNNQAMNEAIRRVALQYLDGNQLTEGLLNYIEVAIRAFDPCLSCATHAIGKMPLEIELTDIEGKMIQRLIKDSDGQYRNLKDLNVRPLLIFGYGNPSRGDDALGPLLLERLEAINLPHVELLTDFQLQVEHALDLRDRDKVLFIDASVSCTAPYAFSRLQPQKDTNYSSHAMSPTAVLHVYREIYGTPPPLIFWRSAASDSNWENHSVLEAGFNLEASLGLVEKTLFKHAICPNGSRL